MHVFYFERINAMTSMKKAVLPDSGGSAEWWLWECQPELEDLWWRTDRGTLAQVRRAERMPRNNSRDVEEPAVFTLILPAGIDPNAAGFEAGYRSGYQLGIEDGKDTAHVSGFNQGYSWGARDYARGLPGAIAAERELAEELAADDDNWDSDIVPYDQCTPEEKARRDAELANLFNDADERRAAEEFNRKEEE
jgi:hypothetical protein